MSVAAMLLGGCSGLPSRKAPRLGPAPKGVPPEPPPPPEVVWLRLVGAHVPGRALGGGTWDEDGGLPDPYAVLKLGDHELLRTEPLDDTLEPAWKEGPRGNFEIPADGRLTLEVWDADGLRDQRIVSTQLEAPRAAQVPDGVLQLELERGALVRLAVEPAHPLHGLGFSYRFTGGACIVTERFAHGPAGRAGVRVGDQILVIDDQQLAHMTPAELRSLLLSVPMAGLTMALRQADGRAMSVQIAEGPVYPLLSEFGPID